MQFKAPTSSLKTITNNLTRADEYLQESSNHSEMMVSGLPDSLACSTKIAFSLSKISTEIHLG